MNGRPPMVVVSEKRGNNTPRHQGMQSGVLLLVAFFSLGSVMALTVISMLLIVLPYLKDERSHHEYQMQASRTFIMPEGRLERRPPRDLDADGYRPYPVPIPQQGEGSVPPEFLPGEVQLT